MQADCSGRSALFKKMLALCYEEKNRRLYHKNLYNWSLQARPSQKIPSGDWKIWLILAGRGFGKTRTGAETIRLWVQQKQCKRVCLLGHTLSEVRSVMVEGVSGLLAVHPDDEKVVYNPSQHRILWPNGAVATGYSAASYEKLRGPQFDGAWIDELAKFPHPQETWDQLMLGLRLGHWPRVVITTTPRPIPLLKHLLNREDVVVTTGHTFENAANLSTSYLQTIEKNYGHTRLGRQEIEGQWVDNTPGALWTIDMLDRAKINTPPNPLKRVVVAIDPATTCNASSDETGLIVAGIDEEGKGYILEDLSGKFTATEWAHIAVAAYHRHQADRIVAEVNNGGDLVEKLMRTVDPQVAYTGVRATRGKITRAEPIAALYEQGKIFHIQSFSKLEGQMLTYTGRLTTQSPDRLDALVWALTDLLLGDKKNDMPRPLSPQKIWML